MGIATTHTG